MANQADEGSGYPREHGRRCEWRWLCGFSDWSSMAWEAWAVVMSSLAGRNIGSNGSLPLSKVDGTNGFQIENDAIL